MWIFLTPLPAVIGREVGYTLDQSTHHLRKPHIYISLQWIWRMDRQGPELADKQLNYKKNLIGLIQFKWWQLFHPINICSLNQFQLNYIAQMYVNLAEKGYIYWMENCHLLNCANPISHFFSVHTDTIKDSHLRAYTHTDNHTPTHNLKTHKKHSPTCHTHSILLGPSAENPEGQPAPGPKR